MSDDEPRRPTHPHVAYLHSQAAGKMAAGARAAGAAATPLAILVADQPGTLAEVAAAEERASGAADALYEVANDILTAIELAEANGASNHVPGLRLALRFVADVAGRHAEADTRAERHAAAEGES